LFNKYSSCCYCCRYFIPVAATNNHAPAPAASTAEAHVHVHVHIHVHMDRLVITRSWCGLELTAIKKQQQQHSAEAHNYLHEWLCPLPADVIGIGIDIGIVDIMPWRKYLPQKGRSTNYGINELEKGNTITMMILLLLLLLLLRQIFRGRDVRHPYVPVQYCICIEYRIVSIISICRCSVSFSVEPYFSHFFPLITYIYSLSIYISFYIWNNTKHTHTHTLHYTVFYKDDGWDGMDDQKGKKEKADPAVEVKKKKNNNINNKMLLIQMKTRRRMIMIKIMDTDMDMDMGMNHRGKKKQQQTTFNHNHHVLLLRRGRRGRCCRCLWWWRTSRRWVELNWVELSCPRQHSGIAIPLDTIQARWMLRQQTPPSPVSIKKSQQFTLFAGWGSGQVRRFGTVPAAQHTTPNNKHPLDVRHHFDRYRYRLCCVVLCCIVFIGWT